MGSLKSSCLQNDHSVDAEGVIPDSSEPSAAPGWHVQSYPGACEAAIWFVEEIDTFNINHHHQNYNKYYIYYLLTPNNTSGAVFRVINNTYVCFIFNIHIG